MNITANMKTNDGNYKAVLEAITFLKHHEVFIGVPEETTTRKDDKNTPVNNAELLFIHTNGSPMHNIPPRPVLEPAIKNNQERIAESMKTAIDAAVGGDKSAILPALEVAGTEGRNVAQKFFTDTTNGWPPNSSETIKRKNKEKSGKANPLIDTEEMRKSITYVVKEV